MNDPVNIFWFRRDLRLDDNAGLFHALQAGLPVIPIFIFDKDILSELDDPRDRRVAFIYQVVQKLQHDLSAFGSSLVVLYGKPIQEIEKFSATCNVQTVFTNHDYEPYAINRDLEVRKMLENKAIRFITYKDQVIFEKNEIVKPDGKYYSVFTPYSKKWKATLVPGDYGIFRNGDYIHNFKKQSGAGMPALSQMGFSDSYNSVEWKIDERIIKDYHNTRNIPSLQGTTRAGMHLRFGTVSIRKLVSRALELNETFLNELIWREFFMQMLWHLPRLEHECFRTEFESISWRNNEMEFERWCEGKTGYPIVDAGMRELNETGFMHNRVRMITASFLVKHLLIDWRWGEAYFAKKLLDYELASNIGNWQWVAGCGCDAAPYFRIFSPAEQTKKFDPKGEYIRKWLPELMTPDYVSPIVDHAFARDRCLAVYKTALAARR